MEQVVIFLSPLTDNWKNNFLVLGESPTDHINGGVSAKKSLVLTLVKQKENFV